MKKVAVVGVTGGWSSEKLADAIEDLSGFRCLIDLAGISCQLETGRFFFKEIDLTSLDGLAIKKLGEAYSPSLFDRLEILQHLASSGPRIFSRPESIHRVLNRLSCTTRLAQGGIPIPPTFLAESPKLAARAVREYGRAVLKPLYTSKAKGMAVVEDGPYAQEEIENYKASVNGIIYVQKMMNLPGQDLGIVFLGGQYLATYARVGQKGAWNTTTASGGRYKSYEPKPELIELADRAQKLFNLDFTCVDVAESDQGPVVFEVSAFGGFRGLMEGCGLDAAQLYARYILEALDK